MEKIRKVIFPILLKRLIHKWRNITRELANELWIAREILSKPGARTDLGKNLPRFTWSGYCAEIGIDYHTANRWLNQWFPESLTLENKPLVFLSDYLDKNLSRFT